MRLRAGLGVFHRPDGIQIGSYPNAVIFDNLSARERELLVFLRRHLPSSRVRSKAETLGIPQARFDELTAMLDQADVLAPPYPSATKNSASVQITIAKSQDTLQFHRLKPLLEPLVHSLHDDGLSIGIDYRGTDIGPEAPQKLSTLLDCPLTDTLNPTLGVLVFPRAPSIALATHYFCQHIPYRSVVVTETTVEVGPLTQFGASPCLHCVDLHYSDADPHFDTVRSQLSDQPFPALADRVLMTAGYATAVAIVDSIRGCGLLPGEVRGIASDLVTERFRFPVHPACGCGLTPVQWLDGQSLVAESQTAPI
ncbi:MAG: hypothetical protein Q4P71_08240 [Actinomycetaceae bacterium]|nr:hypothetical protein [Actinomycetaceae bacterium]